MQMERSGVRRIRGKCLFHIVNLGIESLTNSSDHISTENVFVGYTLTLQYVSFQLDGGSKGLCY